MTSLRQLISSVNGQTRRVLTASARSGVRLLGVDLLDKAQTNAFLAPYRVGLVLGNSINLPEVMDAVDQTKRIFSNTEGVSTTNAVWHYTGGSEPTTSLPCGLVKIGRSVLNTDYWSRDVMKDLLNRKSRTTRTARTLIAPFGHYFDGSVFVGYYDFMLLVAAKLCRMRAMLPDAVFADAVVSYPLLHTHYEREVLAALGFGPDQVIDSRATAVQFEQCVLGSHENWAYQTSGDILALQTKLGERLLQPGLPTGNRVYISRDTRRRVTNETELIELLTQYDFQIIEDKPRTVAEQRAIYHNASFIMGPHGASFCNLIWCRPGTHLFELFSPLFITDCFRYLAQLQNLSYSAYCNGSAGSYDTRYISEDITVSIPDLKRYLDGTLAIR